MDDIAAADPGFVFLPEFQQRVRCVACAGFDLNGVHFIFCLAVIGDNEVDFNVVALFLLAVMGVEEQPVTIGCQHLRNDIFVEHSLVQPQFAIQDLLVDFILQQLVFVESVAEKQPRVPQIALDIGVRFCQRQPHIGVIGTAAFIGDHGIGQPEEGFLILIRRRTGGDPIEHDPLFVPGEQAGNLVKNRQHLGAVLRLNLHDVVPIQCQNVPFFQISLAKVFPPFQERNNAHGHPTHKHILLEQEHGLIVKRSLQRLPLFKASSDISDHRLFAQCPAEFLKVQGIHFHLPFLGRNHNVLDVFLNGNQRTGFHIVIAPIGNQVLNGLSGFGEQLHFIEDDHAVPFVQLDTILDRQQHEECVQVIQIQLEVFLYITGCFRKVNQNIAFVLVLCELLYNCGLSDSPRSLDQQCFLTGTLCFPGQELVVNLSLE